MEILKPIVEQNESTFSIGSGIEVNVFSNSKNFTYSGFCKKWDQILYIYCGGRRGDTALLVCTPTIWWHAHLRKFLTNLS